MSDVLVIAEAGVNHNGSIERALELVDIAAEAGADVVKFQTFDTNALVTADAPRAQYQSQNTGSDASQYEMLKALELDRAAHERIIERCAERGLEFLSTGFDLASLALLRELGIRRVKIPSGELTNGPLILAATRFGLPMILSTGMADLADIEAALEVVAFGLTASAEASPSPEDRKRALSSRAAQEALAERVTVLHCTSAYPAPLSDVNLRAMTSLHAAFGTAVGYSDHTRGIAVPIAAVALGASVIEKHFTTDRTLEGPDHAASLEPDELVAMVAGIRDVERALGDARKRPTPSEVDTALVARKSVVAAGPIAAGEPFDEDNLTIMRPGTGRSPMAYWELLGREARRDYARHELIDD